MANTDFKLPFGKKNYLIFGLAVLVIAIGYFFLGQNSLTLAPILLFVGYCVLIPVALIVRENKTDKSSETATE